MKLLLPVFAIVLAGAGLKAAQSSDGHHKGGLHRHLVELFHGPQAGHHGHAGHGGEMLERHLDQLAEHAELTPDQRRQAAEILATSGIAERVHQLLTAHARQASAIHASPFDEAAVRTASQAVGKAQEELAVCVGALLHAVHATLTPEQLERLAHEHPHLLPAMQEHVKSAEASLQRWIERNR